MLRRLIILFFIIVLAGLAFQPTRPARAALVQKSPSNLGLVGYWSFDEGKGTKALDSSGKKNTGTVSNASWVDGKRGKALSFNGSNSSVAANAALVTPDTNNFSFSFWIKTSGFGDLIQGANGNAGTVTHGYALVIPAGWGCSSNGQLYLNFANGTTRDTGFCSNKIVNDGKWHHVSVVVTRGSTVKYYIDGNLDNTLNTTLAGTVFLAQLSFGQIAWQGWFNGLLDDVRIYNRALAQAEVTSLYQAGTVTVVNGLTGVTANASQNSKLTNGLVGYWPFNGKDVSGTTAYDRSGQNNNGTITGAKPTFAKVGQALSFNGSGSYVSVPYSAALAPTSAISYGAWFKTSDVTANSRILSKTEFGGYNLAFNDNASGLTATVNTSNGGYHYVNFTEVKNNTWYHAMVTYDGSAVKLYVNGSQASSTPATGSISFTRTNPLCIGSEPNSTACTVGNYFSGQIDEVRFYNRALTASEIKQLYQMGK